MARSTGVPSAVFSRYFASQIWREIGAIRSETDPIIASTFISMALPYLSPPGIAPAILRSGQGRCSDGYRGACGLLLRRPRCEGDRRDPVRRPPAGLLSCRWSRMTPLCPPLTPARHELNPDNGYTNLNKTLALPRRPLTSSGARHASIA